MARSLAFVFLALAAGCSSDGLPITGSGTQSGFFDGGAPSNSSGPGAPSSNSGFFDGGLRPDIGRHDDGGPRCMTACDCPPGQGCVFGRCAAPFGMIYCCASNICPGSSFCQQPTGQLSRCGGAPGGGPLSDAAPFPIPFDAGPIPFDAGPPLSVDLGGAGYCGLIPCSRDYVCQIAGCGRCDPTANRCM
jgi:hypothetical protein